MQALGSGIARFLLRLWRIIRWPLAIIAAIYVLLVIYYLFELPKESKATVAAIQTQKLTMKDVDGSNLPPVPDPKLVDATVEGIDANKNGIRDDVEIALSKYYANNPKLRAASMQYAMSLQTYITKVRDRDTWLAANDKKVRAKKCISASISSGDNMAVTGAESLVEQKLLNTDARLHSRINANVYATSFSIPSGAPCDVDLK